MTVHATINIVSLYADIFGVRTSVAPPFGRAEESGDGCARRDSQMGRPCVAADVEARALRQSIKAFQGWTDREGFSRPAET